MGNENPGSASTKFKGTSKRSQVIQRGFKGNAFVNNLYPYHQVLPISFKEIQTDLKGVFTYAGMVLVYHRVLQISFKEIQADLKRVFTYAGTVLVYHRVLLISFEEISGGPQGSLHLRGDGLSVP